MTKTLDAITEAVRNPKHLFTKPLKHRYERRKVREYLQLGEWLEEEVALSRNG